MPCRDCLDVHLYCVGQKNFLRHTAKLPDLFRQPLVLELYEEPQELLHPNNRCRKAFRGCSKTVNEFFRQLFYEFVVQRWRIFQDDALSFLRFVRLWLENIFCLYCRMKLFATSLVHANKMIQAATSLCNTSCENSLHGVFFCRRSNEFFAEGISQLYTTGISANPTGRAAGVGRNRRLGPQRTVGVLQHKAKVVAEGAQSTVGVQARVYQPEAIRKCLGRFWRALSFLKCIHGIFLDDGC